VVERTVRRSSRLPGRSGVRAQGPAHLEQAFTQHGALRGEIPLVLHVGGLALGRFDLDRFIPPLTQVVRRGTHVQGPYLTGQGEAVRDQLRGCRRDELVGPLVQIHGLVQATGLVQLDLCRARWTYSVTWTYGIGEESNRVEVRTLEAVGLHHTVGALAAQS